MNMRKFFCVLVFVFICICSAAKAVELAFGGYGFPLLDVYAVMQLMQLSCHLAGMIVYTALSEENRSVTTLPGVLTKNSIVILITQVYISGPLLLDGIRGVLPKILCPALLLLTEIVSNLSSLYLYIFTDRYFEARDAKAPTTTPVVPIRVRPGNMVIIDLENVNDPSAHGEPQRALGGHPSRSAEGGLRVPGPRVKKKTMLSHRGQTQGVTNPSFEAGEEAVDDPGFSGIPGQLGSLDRGRLSFELSPLEHSSDGGDSSSYSSARTTKEHASAPQEGSAASEEEPVPSTSGYEPHAMAHKDIATPDSSGYQTTSSGTARKQDYPKGKSPVVGKGKGKSTKSVDVSLFMRKGQKLDPPDGLRYFSTASEMQTCTLESDIRDELWKDRESERAPYRSNKNVFVSAFDSPPHMPGSANAPPHQRGDSVPARAPTVASDEQARSHASTEDDMKVQNLGDQATERRWSDVIQLQGRPGEDITPLHGLRPELELSDLRVGGEEDARRLSGELEPGAASSSSRGGNVQAASRSRNLPEATRSQGIPDSSDTQWCSTAGGSGCLLAVSEQGKDGVLPESLMMATASGSQDVPEASGQQDRLAEPRHEGMSTKSERGGTPQEPESPRVLGGLVQDEGDDDISIETTYDKVIFVRRSRNPVEEQSSQDVTGGQGETLVQRLQSKTLLEGDEEFTVPPQQEYQIETLPQESADVPVTGLHRSAPFLQERRSATLLHGHRNEPILQEHGTTPAPPALQQHELVSQEHQVPPFPRQRRDALIPQENPGPLILERHGDTLSQQGDQIPPFPRERRNALIISEYTGPLLPQKDQRNPISQGSEIPAFPRERRNALVPQEYLGPLIPQKQATPQFLQNPQYAPILHELQNIPSLHGTQRAQILRGLQHDLIRQRLEDAWNRYGHQNLQHLQEASIPQDHQSHQGLQSAPVPQGRQRSPNDPTLPGNVSSVEGGGTQAQSQTPLQPPRPAWTTEDEEPHVEVMDIGCDLM